MLGDSQFPQKFPRTLAGTWLSNEVRRLYPTRTLFEHTQREYEFRHFYEACRIPLGTFLYRLLANRQDVEDLYQEVFRRFWVHLLALPAGPLEKSEEMKWLFTVARHLAVDHYRKQGKLQTTSIDEVEQTHMTPGRLEDQVCEQDHLVRALARMTPMYRMCLVLQDLYGYSQQEIAEQLDIAKKTVSSNVLRARKQLLTVLEDVHRDQQK
jgi:RNA polymerase sigma-70 factor (ECF subfamily)